MTTPDLARLMLERLAEEGAQKMAYIIGWFPQDADGAESAFAFLAERNAIVLISGTGPEDPFARWAISAELLLRFVAEASAGS